MLVNENRKRITNHDELLMDHSSYIDSVKPQKMAESPSRVSPTAEIVRKTLVSTKDSGDLFLNESRFRFYLIKDFLLEAYPYLNYTEAASMIVGYPVVKKILTKTYTHGLYDAMKAVNLTFFPRLNAAKRDEVFTERELEKLEKLDVYLGKNTLRDRIREIPINIKDGLVRRIIGITSPEEDFKTSVPTKKIRGRGESYEKTRSKEIAREMRKFPSHYLAGY